MSGATNCDAARASFSNLFIPGTVAILTDTVGFLTIYLVKVPIIQELAITASLGRDADHSDRSLSPAGPAVLHAHDARLPASG